VHRRAEEINETTKQWVRHRGLKLVFDHAEVVKCDISATANTLKSRDTPNLLSPTPDSARRPDFRSHAGDASSGRTAPPIFQSVSFRQGQAPLRVRCRGPGPRGGRSPLHQDSARIYPREHEPFLREVRGAAAGRLRGHGRGVPGKYRERGPGTRGVDPARRDLSDNHLAKTDLWR